MVRFTFAKDAPAALKGMPTVCVIAAQSIFQDGRLPKVLPPRLLRLLSALAAEVKPGDHGATGATLTQAAPKKLIAGVLPNRVSRYNAPARPEGIFRVLQSAGLSREPKAGVVLILDEPEHATAALVALGRAFPLYTAKSEEKGDPRLQVALIDRQGLPVKLTATAKETMHAAREAALLVDTPPSDLHPEALAAAARRLLEGLPHVEVHELVGEELLTKRLSGIHAVGRAAVHAPRMLLASYAPPRPRRAHVALVGKGITFDTGGLHLKARGMMESMKSDMGGAAAVLGAFRVLAKSGVDRPLTLVLCIAENAVGPESYKPDDVLRLHSGKTVEINNTDAEGRLLLADGVSYAVRQVQAPIVIDAATLTGAQLIATGLMHAAVVSNDADLEALFVAAGKASGDLVHPLPFAPELYKAEFKSPVADMRNSVKDRANAQSSCAAQFIYNHIEDTEARWVHVDLAGPAFRTDRGTGYGVALLVEAASRLSD